MSDFGKDALTKATFGVTMTEASRRMRAFQEEAEAQKMGRHGFVFDNALRDCFQCGKAREHPVHSPPAAPPMKEQGDA